MEKLNWRIPDALRWLVYSYAHYSTERFSSERSLPVDRITSRTRRRDGEQRDTIERRTSRHFDIRDILSQIRISLVCSLTLSSGYAARAIISVVTSARKSKSTMSPDFREGSVQQVSTSSKYLTRQ